MRFLVTGGTGFIGRNLVRSLAASNHEVIVISRSPSQSAELGVRVITLPGWPFSDISDEWLKALMELGPLDYVVHLAGDPRYGNGTQYQKSNVDLTRTFIRTLELLDNPPKFIFASSIGAVDYVKFQAPVTRNENAPRNPLSDYGQSKLDAESIVGQSCLASAVLRFGMVFGSDMRNDSHLAVLSRLIRFGALRWLLRSSVGVLPMVSVEDAVSAIRLIAERNLGGTFNVVGENLGISEIVETIAGVGRCPRKILRLGKAGSLLPAKVAPLTAPLLAFDSSKLRNQGWSVSGDYLTQISRLFNSRSSSGKFQIVVGCASGLGLEIFRCLSRTGENVIGIDRDELALQNLAAAFPSQTTLLGDVNEANLFERISELANDHFEKLRYGDLYLVAGLGHRGSILSTPSTIDAELFSVNVLSRLRLVREYMSKVLDQSGSSRIVLVSSSTALQPLHSFGSYSATNAALLAFGRVLIQELKATSVRAHVILPAGMRTSFQKIYGVKQPRFEKLLDPSVVARKMIRQKHRSSRIVLIGSKARLMLFLSKVLPVRVNDAMWAGLSKRLR